MGYDKSRKLSMNPSFRTPKRQGGCKPDHGKSAAARGYNDSSVLENFHAALLGRSFQ